MACLCHGPAPCSGIVSGHGSHTMLCMTMQLEWSTVQVCTLDHSSCMVTPHMGANQASSCCRRSARAAQPRWLLSSPWLPSQCLPSAVQPAGADYARAAAPAVAAVANWKAGGRAPAQGREAPAACCVSNQVMQQRQAPVMQQRQAPLAAAAKSDSASSDKAPPWTLACRRAAPALLLDNAFGAMHGTQPACMPMSTAVHCPCWRCAATPGRISLH